MMLRRSNSLASPAVLLAVCFASLYAAAGPGCFFSVDEVLVEETAQAVVERGALDIPAMNTAKPGVAESYYSNHGPALGFVALPFAAAGILLDDKFGSLRGGTAAGPPLGVPEHPLRWGGRLAIFAILLANALVGGATVAVLYLTGVAMGSSKQAALLMAAAAGAATLLGSESTHFFQHPLEALTLLLGFYFFRDSDLASLARRAALGSISLGLAVLARPNAAPAAAILWCFGVVVASRAGGTGRRERRQVLVRAALIAVAIPVLCGGLYLYYNFLRFGGFLEFGYTSDREQLGLALGQTVRAIAAYLASPSLSLFLFAPPLVLAIPVLGESLRRWPLELRALLLASLVHLLMLCTYRTWHGDLSFGPRFMLAPIVLLMPLTLPAFERAVDGARIWRGLVAAAVGTGLLVQALGTAIFVTTNEWYRVQAGINDSGAWVFVPSASPILVDLRDLLAGRNLIPWAIRALKEPGAALVVWIALVAAIFVGSARLALRLWTVEPVRGRVSGLGDRSALPDCAAVALAVLVVAGFLFSGRVREPHQAHTETLLARGRFAQEQGRNIAAEELYALVLGLDPARKDALSGMALLEEKAGNFHVAVTLYERSLGTDLSFEPSRRGLARIRPDLKPLLPTPKTPSNASPIELFNRGQALWDVGDKEGALALWEEAERRFPAEPWFVRRVARCRYDLGDFDGAVRDYRSAAKMLPKDIGVKIGLAWALLETDESDQARAIVEAVLAEDPGNVEARSILSRARADH